MFVAVAILAAGAAASSREFQALWHSVNTRLEAAALARRMRAATKQRPLLFKAGTPSEVQSLPVGRLPAIRLGIRRRTRQGNDPV